MGGQADMRKVRGSKKITPQAKHMGRYWCKNCRSYFTARTGTPLEYGRWMFGSG